MLVFHHTNNLRFLNKPSSDLLKLFLAGVCRKISQTFVSIFSSVFIYQSAQEIGYSVKGSILVAIGFYILMLLLKGAAIMAAEDYSREHGFKNSIETSLLPFVVSIISFILSTYSIYFLIPAAVFWGIHAGFYWWGYHGYFIKSGDYGNFGKELGQVGVLETVAAISSPFLGSLVIDLFGFRSVYVLSFLFMLLAVYLISKGEDKKQKHDTDLSEMLFLFRKHKMTAMAYIGSALEGTVYVVMWPLFLYLFFNNIVEMGSIISVAVLLAAVLGIFAGHIEDRSGERKLLSWGTPVVVLSWVLRFFSNSVGLFIVADSLWNIGQKMVGMPMIALSYKKAIRRYTAPAIMFRELSVTIGAAAGLTIIGIIFYISPSFAIVFIVTALFSMFTILPVLTREFDDKKR